MFKFKFRVKYLEYRVKSYSTVLNTVEHRSTPYQETDKNIQKRGVFFLKFILEFLIKVIDIYLIRIYIININAVRQPQGVGYDKQRKKCSNQS